MKHVTKETWTLSPNGLSVLHGNVCIAAGCTSAWFPDQGDNSAYADENAKARIRLMAAAPRLLAGLNDALDYIDDLIRTGAPSHMRSCEMAKYHKLVAELEGLPKRNTVEVDVSVLEQALKIVNAYRGVALGDGDVTASNLRHFIEQAKGTS